MPLNSQSTLGLYLMLSHPLSAIKRKADALAPQPTLDAAYAAVADMINTALNLMLDSESKEYAGLKGKISEPKLYSSIEAEDGSVTYKLDTTPETMLALDGYSIETGCPSISQCLDIYQNLN